MSNALQRALANGFAVLLRECGESFTLAGTSFTAVPAQGQIIAGRLEDTPDNLNWYEAEASTAPAFSRGAKLIGSDSLTYAVEKRLPVNPTTGIFRFAIHPGR